MRCLPCGKVGDSETTRWTARTLSDAWFCYVNYYSYGLVRMSAWAGKTELKEKMYCYVDGGAVRSACKKYATFFGEKQLSLSWEKVAHPFERMFYYDALPGTPNKGESKNEFQTRLDKTRENFEEMRKTKGVFVNYGVSVRRRKQIEQKRVDTMIAVDMLTHAQRGLVGEMMIVTNDQDFFPVIVAVMELGVKVHLLCDPQKTNDEFMYLSDETTRLDLFSLFRWLPDEFQKNHKLPNINPVAGNINGALWNEGSFAIGKNSNSMWQLQKLDTRVSYFHNDIVPLLEYASLEWPNCPELDVVLQKVKEKGANGFLT